MASVRKPMPPRYIAVPFLSGGILPIPLPILTVTAVSGSQINASIGYSGPPGATSYAFEKSSAATGPFSPIASGTSPTFSDTGLPSSTTFFYRARVQVTDGRFSDYADVKSASTLASPPGPVTGVAATGSGTTTVQVTWNAVGTTPLSGYHVFRDGVLVSTQTTLLFNDSGLTPSTLYTYSVSAYNSAGDGPVGQDTAITDALSTGPTSVKWNPGHYAESDTKLQVGATLATIKSEIDAIASLSNVKGYMIIACWGFLQQAENTYTFSELTNIVNYIKSKGKRWALQVVAGNFNYGTNPPTHASSSFVPSYINDGNTTRWGTAGTRANGVTTVLSGESGWWGGDGNGHTYAAALWRTNVMTEWIKLHQALGAAYDSDPSCEMIYQGENSFYQGTASTNNSPDYNDVTQTNLWKNWLQALCASWPTTIVGYSNTFMQFQNNTIALCNYITDGTFPNHPPTMARTDTFGSQQRSGSFFSWGAQAYAGQLGTLGDRRSSNRYVAEVQAPDMGFFIADGAPSSDVLVAANDIHTTHLFWAVVPSPISPSGSPYRWAVTLTAVPTGTTGTLTTPWPLPSGKWDCNTGGGTMTTIKGSTSVTFSVNPGVSSFTIKFPVIPFNWFNGGTTAPATNGTSQTYTDPGLGAFINNPANALTTSAYPADFP